MTSNRRGSERPVQPSASALTECSLVSPLNMAMKRCTSSSTEAAPAGIENSSESRIRIRIGVTSEKASWQPKNDFRHVSAQKERREQRHQPGQDRYRSALDGQFSHARQDE